MKTTSLRAWPYLLLLLFLTLGIPLGDRFFRGQYEEQRTYRVRISTSGISPANPMVADNTDTLKERSFLLLYLTSN